MIRFSRVIRSLREDGEGNIADVVERARKQYPPCETHGEIADPLTIMNQHGTLFFGCPFCSGRLVRERWEAEGEAESTRD